MDVDLDIFDDILPNQPAARKVKFQPKSKPKPKFQPKSKSQPPRKEPAAASVSSSQAVQTIDSAQSELSDPVPTTKLSDHGSEVVAKDNGGPHSTVEKSVGENADILTEFESLGDVLPQTTSDKECTVPSSEAVDLSPTTASEPIVSSCDGRDHILEKGLGSEEKDSLDSMNTTELTTKSGQRTEKDMPEPNIQMHKEICEANESVSDSLGPQSVSPETGYAEQDSIPISEQDDVLDLSSLGFTHTLPEEGNLMEMSQLDSDINLEGFAEVPTKLTSRRAKTGSNISHSEPDPSPQQQNASTSNQENETDRLLRPRKSKTNFCELVDEDEDEVLASGDFSEEFHPSSAIEEENINNEEFQVENEQQMKKEKRKSDKTDDGKPPRKRKTAKEATNQDAGAKRKRFPHSTRRRQVDKVLLETPEDDIDYQSVPLRDLILLAEHREKQTKKEEAAVRAQAQAAKQSNGLYDEEDTSNQDGDAAEDTTLYFNYQTYMDKTPKSRWSKQETELFYEAMGQFGTDLSMIQQLFPGRTRRQIKLKYKKEERQQPLRLREALTNRSKDLSHFKRVIESLKQNAAEENENADKDDLTDLWGNEEADEGTSNADKDDLSDLKGNDVADEGISNADDEEAKDERIEEEKNEDLANNSTEVQNPLEPDDEDDDDLFLWSQYKSDT
ncbi:hypothetical protein ABFX02_06G088200 [Erythranthe guttata]